MSAKDEINEDDIKEMLEEYYRYYTRAAKCTYLPTRSRYYMSTTIWGKEDPRR